jgi:hypothetical protein
MSVLLSRSLDGEDVHSLRIHGSTGPLLLTSFAHGGIPIVGELTLAEICFRFSQHHDGSPASSGLNSQIPEGRTIRTHEPVGSNPQARTY